MAARAASAGRWVWVKGPCPAAVPAASAAKPAPVASRTPKAGTAASRAKPQPACRFAHLGAVRPEELAAAPSRATVRSFRSSKRAAAFVLAALSKAGPARPSGGTPEDVAAFILAAAAKARPNRDRNGE